MANKFETIQKEIREKTSSKGITNFSKEDYVNITHGIINSPDQEFKEYQPNGDVKIVKPSGAVRRAMGNEIIKHLDVDKESVKRFIEADFSKSTAVALAEFCPYPIKESMRAGRKFNFPINTETESKMSTKLKDVPTKTVATNFIQKQEDGSYVSKPTGKKSTTKAHTNIVVSNKLPRWLRESENI